MLRYLLDTNVISEALRPRPRHAIVRKLRQHELEIAIASIVWHELRFGANRLPPSARKETYNRYLESVVASAIPILDYDRDAAEWHARERARLSRAGQTPSFVDGQIAAIAHVHDLTLVTFNVADFRRFQDLRISTWS